MAPSRRLASIRRTSSLDADWPEGREAPIRMRGRARDLFTPTTGGGVVLAEDWIEVRTPAATREILTLTASRRNDEAQALVGCRGGGHLRREIARVLPDERAQGTPLYLLLDDFSGASLVAGWAWSRFTPDWKERMLEQSIVRGGGKPVRMEGICSGFAPGSSALFPDGTHDPSLQSCARVPPLADPTDPQGWHELTVQLAVGMRRARRIDVFHEDDFLRVEVHFQDSANNPDGGRTGVHEYLLEAIADPDTFEVLSITADPRVLPYRECPNAAANVDRLRGVRLSDFRSSVLERLPGVLGCTHLNDVLRALEDVPQLAGRLRELTELGQISS